MITATEFIVNAEQQADDQLPIVLFKLLERLSNIENKPFCRKHDEILPAYVKWCVRVTKLKRDERFRLGTTILNQALDQAFTWKLRFHGESCTCEESPDEICVCCGTHYDIDNGCRHPPHLNRKRKKQEKKKEYFEFLYPFARKKANLKNSKPHSKNEETNA